jgi:hypothetical protein
LDGEWLAAYMKKMKTSGFKRKFRARKCVVEHPFGTMKYLMGQIPILLRGKAKVQIEMDLYSTAYNLKRMLTLETMPKLREQPAVWLPVPAFLPVLPFLFARNRIYCRYRH